jgi:hypothetical protein
MGRSRKRFRRGDEKGKKQHDGQHLDTKRVLIFYGKFIDILKH